MSKSKKKNSPVKKPVQYDLFTGRPVEDELERSEELLLLDWKSTLMRMIIIKGEPWWVLADVARVLGYRDAEQASRLLREKHKGTTLNGTPGLQTGMLLVNEPGLYRLMMRSDHEEAERFQDWITEEVLPEIRRTGTYSAHSSRAGKWKRRLKCDDATAKKRVDQVNINKRTHSRIFAEKGGVTECAAWHNAAYAGQFGDDITAGQLRTDLVIPGWDTPLNHMGLVPLSVNDLAKAITEKTIEDSGPEVDFKEQAEILKRNARTISENAIKQLGREAGSEYTYRIVHKSKRGMIIDTVQKQLTSQ